MTQLIEDIRTAYLFDEVTTVLGYDTYRSDVVAMKQEVRRGEAVPLTYLDLYPERLTELGTEERTLAEESLIYNAGRMRVAAARLRHTRQASASELVPTEEDYLTLAHDIGAIIAMQSSEVLTFSKRRTGCTAIDR
jgi:hypothetical protein